ncbi:MAG: ATP-binding protein, partial [Desulfovibrionaceae bacterium]
MDPIRNPFVPGAGTPPAKLAGRDELLERTRVTLERVRLGKSAKSFIVVGLRGVGKTVLLNEVLRTAEALGFTVLDIEAHEGKSLPALLVPRLRQALFRLDDGEKASAYARRGLKVLAAFANAIRVKYEDVEWGLSIEGEKGSADSGDLEIDLAEL